MFLSKQFRNFVYSKTVQSVFCDCIFQVPCANLTQISLFVLEILSKKFVTQQQINLFRSRLAHYILRHNCFFLRNCFVTKFCKVCIYVFSNKFFSEKCVFNQIHQRLCRDKCSYKQILLFHIHTKPTQTIRHIQTALRLSLAFQTASCSEHNLH